MHKVLLLGAGKIGQMIATFLAEAGDYRLRVGDVDPLRSTACGRWPTWKPCCSTRPTPRRWPAAAARAAKA